MSDHQYKRVIELGHDSAALLWNENKKRLELWIPPEAVMEGVSDEVMTLAAFFELFRVDADETIKQMKNSQVWQDVKSQLRHLAEHYYEELKKNEQPSKTIH